MSCIHLQRLYHLSCNHQIKLGALDLVRYVCRSCDEKGVCPSTSIDELESGTLFGKSMDGPSDPPNPSE